MVKQFPIFAQPHLHIDRNSAASKNVWISQMNDNEVFNDKLNGIIALSYTMKIFVPFGTSL